MEKETFLSLSTIKSERGWTDSLIKQFLKEPDKTSPNPYYKSAAPVKLWREQKVLEMEAMPLFQEMKKKVALRQSSAHRAVKTKTGRLLEYISTVKIEVPVLTKGELKNRAIDHYNNRILYFNGDYKEPASTNSDENFLDRISNNYLRHCCSVYEEELDKIAGKTGKNEAYSALREKIDNAILDLYPFLIKTIENTRTDYQ